MILNRVLFGTFGTITKNQSTLHKRINLQSVRKYKNFGHARDKESLIDKLAISISMGVFLIIPFLYGYVHISEQAAENQKPPNERIEYDESLHNYNS